MQFIFLSFFFFLSFLHLVLLSFFISFFLSFVFFFFFLFCSTRHPRFGGAFEIKDPGRGANKFFGGALAHLRDPSKTSTDANKTSKKKKVQVDPETETLHVSPPEVLVILNKFAADFLQEGFNLLMPMLQRQLTSGEEVMPYDEVHFAQLLRFFFFFFF